MELRELHGALRAMSDLARFRLLQYLANYQEVTVSDLTLAVHISQPLASWHLRTLRKAGLVKTRRVGRQVHCSINKTRIEECGQAIADLAKSSGDRGAL
jgi:ArsR family transcriptional regulator, arsenate/arsenite/antimonite-responsive transcriptional repressor